MGDSFDDVIRRYERFTLPELQAEYLELSRKIHDPNTPDSTSAVLHRRAVEMLLRKYLADDLYQDLQRRGKESSESPAGRMTPPPQGPDVFKEVNDDGTKAQAALLLAMGILLRGDDAAAECLATTTGHPGGTLLPHDDIKDFPLPELKPTTIRLTAESLASMLAVELRDFGIDTTVLPPDFAISLCQRLADRLFNDPQPTTAALLLEAALKHPSELVRVASASSHAHLRDDPQPLLKILRDGTTSDNLLVSSVASTALAHLEPIPTELQRIPSPHPALPAIGAQTSLLVHGTWARQAPWWQPGHAGNFHEYIATNVRPNLYAGKDYYAWSGGYSDAARALAALDLGRWVNDHVQQPPDLLTHSHGGSVAILATQAGIRMNNLILLSCPVHPYKYWPDFTRITKVVSVRVHLDLVILADRGGQRFNDPNIHEHVLKRWFEHGDTHEPGIWKRFGVPAML